MSELLSPTALREVRDHLRKHCGIHLVDERLPRITDAVVTRMAELGIEDAGEYRRVLTSPERGSAESVGLAALLTIGETHFFRNKEHWRAFEDWILPRVLVRNAPSRRIRLWSAGCSTGEEAYNLALVLSRTLPEERGWNVEIIGSDLDPSAIATAERAIYTEHSFRGVPSEVKAEYFDPVEPGRYRVRDDMREMVRFRVMNILDASATAGLTDVDVIFCRNVLVYFDTTGSDRALANIHRSLRPDGCLFLGHAESTRGTIPGFVSTSIGGTFIHEPVTSDDTNRPRDTTRSHAAASTQYGLANRGPAPSLRPAPADRPTVRDLGELRDAAMEHLCAEDYSAARRGFAGVLDREPGDSAGLLGMALLLAGRGEGDEALRYCGRVLRAEPMSAEAYCVMAIVHEGLGEGATVQRELEKAIYLDPAFSVAHFRLAGWHHRARRFDAAERAFRAALETLGDDDERRVRLYSGGFSKDAVAQVCARRLGIESGESADQDQDQDAGEDALARRLALHRSGGDLA